MASNRIIGPVSDINAVLHDASCEHTKPVPITVTRFTAPLDLSTADLGLVKARSVPRRNEAVRPLTRMRMEIPGTGVDKRGRVCESYLGATAKELGMAKVAKTLSSPRERVSLMVVVGRDEDRHPGIDVEHEVVVRLLPRQAGRIRAAATYLGSATPRVILGPELESDEG